VADTVRSTSVDEPQTFWQRHGLGLGMAAATTVLMGWGLGRVAFWLDEGATVAATQRTGSGLRTLMSGAEAPLVPYYILLKLFTGATRHVIPGIGSHPEVLYRLPSVIVSVLAGWALIDWLSRRLPVSAVVSTGAMLLLTGGFSRYGQEARPYALVLFLAVVSTILWTRLISDPRRRWIVLYALAVAGLTALHTLGGLLVLVHLIAALVAAEPGTRRRALLRTLFGAVPGLALISPLALATAQNGTGPMYVFPALTFPLASSVFSRIFSYGEHSFLVVGPIVLLALIGLTRVNAPEYRFVARLAACWAVVPLAGLALVVLVHPNLMFGRYVLFIVPAWAILAGLGVTTVADLTRAGAARLRLGPTALTCLTVIVCVALPAGVTVNQAWTLHQVRTPGGHGEDIRPALATADRPEYADMPIWVSSRFGSVQFGIYAPANEKRLASSRFQRDEVEIWPARNSNATGKAFLKKHDRLILMQRTSEDPAKCLETLTFTPAAQIQRCMPKLLQSLHYRVIKVEPSGYGWAFAVIERDPAAT
jgi:hypothetical protein